MIRVALWAWALAVGTGLAAASGPVQAGDADSTFAGLTEMKTGEMAASTGRADSGPIALDQRNLTDQLGQNLNNEKVNIGGVSVSGSIGDTTIDNTRGTTSVMSNTGDFVNMNYSASYNIHLQ
ncbi:hypothetical protein SAMN05216241_104194 [Limimonas halophila]|uniref:Holdfast attachment protein HfaA n=1 Tax=Limimonas halophila TaxID=1082479 RepID=A0A1G7QYG1_9PROT|nr:hypothetical protein [Limimonas halophila]SDG03537.1 hypothetical protein SAMN05216241_104194 [Limimonas halophila]